MKSALSAAAAGVNLRVRFIALRIGVLLCVVTVAQPTIATAQIVTDGSLGAQTSLSGGAVSIAPTLGQQRGSNLFHSFGVFNVNSGQWVNFDSNVGTNNIIARVTGGAASQINGLMTANANLFLLNPQGIVFGNGATVSVAGAFHATTANYLGFSNGARFYADIGAASVLSTSTPTAFGFLTSANGAITASNASFSLSPSSSLSLIGSNISLTDTQIQVPQGQVNLAAVTSPGEAVLGTGTLDTSSLSTKGNITLNQTWVNATGEDAANIFIRGGQFVMQNQSSIAGKTSAATGVRVVDIGVDSMRLDNSLIDFEPRTNGPATNAAIRARQLDVGNSSAIFVAGGGDLSITATDMRVNNSVVGTGTALGAGRAGNLVIQANTLTTDAGALTALSAGEGDAGGVKVTADTITLKNGGGIFSTTSGAGVGGQVVVNARALTIDGTQTTGNTFISAASIGTNSNAGNAGTISIKVDALSMQQGYISSSTNSAGRGGDISLTATNILMTQGAAVTSETGLNGPNGSPPSFGDGGAININSASLQILSGSVVSANTYRNGASGPITVIANQLVVDQIGSALPTGITANSGASSNTLASGSGGNVLINASDLQLRNYGLIGTNTYGAGRAGRIDIASGSMSISESASISASSFGQMANAGSAGDIAIQANAINVARSGQIANSTSGTGAAGRLQIAAKELSVVSGGVLQVSSLSSGSNPGAVGAIQINGDTVNLDAGSINARSFGAAIPGGIFISSRHFTLDHGAVVSATSAGNSNAGSILLLASDSFRLSNASRVTTEALNGSGGDIDLLVSRDLIIRDSQVSTSVLGSTGNGGNINIDPVFTIIDNSSIIARAVQGSGGNITLSTQYLLQSATSSIDASSLLGINGRVSVVSVDVDLDADMAALSADFLNAKQWLSKPCASRQGNDVSQFTVNGRDGAYRSTLDLLASPVPFDLPATSAQLAATHRGSHFASNEPQWEPSLLPVFRPTCLSVSL